MIGLLLLLASVASFSYSNENANTDHQFSFDELYGVGVKAYHDNDWNNTVDKMQSSVSLYKNILDAREVCFRKCKDLKTSVLPDYLDADDLQFFHRANQHAVCRETCEKDQLGNQYNDGINYGLHQAMDKRDIHNYIQISLFKEGKVKEGAQHAATNYYFNPHTTLVQSNVEYYLSHENITEADCVSLEKKAYRDLYIEGQQLYNEDKFEEMVEKLELSLKHFYEELEQCRLMCEGPMLMGSMVVSDAISSLYRSVLECKLACPATLGEFRREDESNFLGSYFHYIQFGYYKTDRFKDAVKSLTTHRRIEPDNEVARMNGAYYQKLQGISRKDFTEREDAKPILDKLEEESRLLEVIKRLTLDESTEVESEEILDDVKLLEEDYEMFPITSEEQPSVSNLQNYSIVETPADHNGIERILIDELLTEDQCNDLMDLTQSCKEGDGYGTKSPHTEKEKFEGLGVLTAAEAALRREANHTQVQMYINASKMVQQILQEQFKLDHLYFSYTHLVCRTAKDGLQDDRQDLSHPVHADNCILDEKKGECNKIPPAYTWRDYSAILYLNEEIEGGEFFFAHSPKDLTPQHQVKPKCGRMVGFSAGKENLHGVHALTKGRRCVIALWLTLDPDYVETAFAQAENLLLQF